MQSNHSKTDLSQTNSLTKWKSGVAWVGNLIMYLAFSVPWQIFMVCDWNDQDFDFKKFKTQKIKFSCFKPEIITEDFTWRKAEENTENCKETQTSNSLEHGKLKKKH